jgi:hypothetical protein
MISERIKTKITVSRLQSSRHRAWQSNVVAVRQQQALLADVERHFNPPQPQPEPEVVYVADDRLGSPNFFDDNYNPIYYHDKFWGRSAK